MIYNFPDSRLRNFKTLCKRGLVAVFSAMFANKNDVGFRNLMPAVSKSFSVWKATFFYTVTDVVFLRSYEKVRRIETGRIVAFMKNFLFASKRKLQKNVCTYSMNFARSSGDSYAAITETISTALPKPATVFYQPMFDQAFFHRQSIPRLKYNVEV